MQLRRYALVGFGAGTVDFLLFAMFAGYLGYHYLVVGACTFSIATALNYRWGVRHVFDSGARFQPRAEIAWVYLVSAIGLGVNQLALLAGIDWFGQNLLLTKLGANLISFSWNYAARAYFVFRPSQT